MGRFRLESPQRDDTLDGTIVPSKAVKRPLSWKEAKRENALAAANTNGRCVVDAGKILRHELEEQKESSTAVARLADQIVRTFKGSKSNIC